MLGDKFVLRGSDFSWLVAIAFCVAISVLSYYGLLVFVFYGMRCESEESEAMGSDRRRVAAS